MVSFIKQLKYFFSIEGDEVIELDCFIFSFGKEDYDNEFNICNEDKDLDEGLFIMKVC